jgi:hypothetical protein
MNENTEEYQVKPERKCQRMVSLPVLTDVVQYDITKYYTQDLVPKTKFRSLENWNL